MRELEEHGKKFPTNVPEIGYDLSILPKNKRYKEGDRLPRDGKTGLERLTYRMYAMRQKASERGQNTAAYYRNQQEKAATTPPKAHSSQNHYSPSPPTTPRPMNQQQQNHANHCATQEKIAVKDTQEALEKIYQGRRISATIAGLALALGCLAALGMFGWWGGLFAILFVPIVGHGINRELTESQYYSIPGSRFSNGDHRCIHCQNRGRSGTGIYIFRKSNDSRKVHQCTNCREPLFYS
jgi:hypothetical protein